VRFSTLWTDTNYLLININSVVVILFIFKSIIMKKNSQKKRGLARKTWLTYLTAFSVVAIALSSCKELEEFVDEHKKGKNNFPLVQLPEGYKIEKVVDGLNYPTTLTWDDEGKMYVSEAGGSMELEQYAPIRILQVEAGKTTVVADVSDEVNVAMVGITWHKGWFYFTHRADDNTGAVSRVNKSGQVELLFKGVLDSQTQHQVNDIQMGPDGRMYVAVGMGGNSSVMDASTGYWIKRNPTAQTTPCQDIVLMGKNFKEADFRTEDKTDSLLTGAYVPFGTTTSPGQVIKGVKLCGGSILSFDPENPAGTIETHAWGFRNMIGFAWDRQTGAMYAAENGYDVRGARPVRDNMDASLRIQEGKWYGVPDFSAGREPLTDPKFEVPDSLQAMVYLNGEPIGKNLGFVIDHQASGLTPPNPSMVLGRHEWNSSPSMMDVAPASWGEWAGQVFISEWGDLAPPTNPLRGKAPAGSQVVRVDAATGNLTPFIRNVQPGPASEQGGAGKGIEHPFGVKFGPDGALYIVDYGVVELDKSQQGVPFIFKKGTGVIWKVSKVK
jgi:glucose/arabinose dehydrogenase